MSTTTKPIELTVICAWCKNICLPNADAKEEGSWIVDTSSEKHKNPSHGICPQCLKKHHPSCYVRIFNTAV